MFDIDPDDFSAILLWSDYYKERGDYIWKTLHWMATNQKIPDKMTHNLFIWSSHPLVDSDFYWLSPHIFRKLQGNKYRYAIEVRYHSFMGAVDDLAYALGHKQ